MKGGHVKVPEATGVYIIITWGVDIFIGEQLRLRALQKDLCLFQQVFVCREARACLDHHIYMQIHKKPI